MTASTFARAAELDGAGRPFVVATVVAVRKPTSARPGASGIVHPDGTIEGWVGGSCAQPVVVREALRALADGQPRLLRLSRDGPAEGRRADGVIELVMTCHSGGTLEIYVEPHLPAPHLWIAGTTPIAGALAALGAAAGWRVTVIDPIAEPDAFPTARVHASADIRGLDPEASPYVVVASQGIWDEEAVGLALTREASYVGPGRLADPRRRRPRLAARGDDGRRGADRRASRAGRPGPRRRDGRGDRPVDPGRARPGPPRPRGLRRVAGSGDGGRRPARVDHPGARRRRHRAGRPGLRDDRGAGPRPPPRRARRASSTRSARSAAGPGSSRSPRSSWPRRAPRR